MIDDVIDDEETVVHALGGLPEIYLSSCLSLGGLLEIAEPRAYAFYIDGSSDVWIANFENFKGAGIDVVVDEENFSLSRFDERFGKVARVKDLPFVEYPFDRWLVGTDEETDLILVLINPLFECREPIIYSFLQSYELTIDCIALEEILLQNSCSPNAELSTSLTFDTIAYGYDDI